MTPVSRTWEVSKTTKVKVRRTGYFLVADFASTAHMIQGQSLDAVFADVVHGTATDKASNEVQVAGYVMLSRGKLLATLWIMQGFSRHMFTRGPPPGPHLLLQKLTGKLDKEGVTEAWKVADEAEASSSKAKPEDAMKQLHRCAHCFLSGASDYMKPATQFGVFTEADIMPKLVSQGAWARCEVCRQLANSKRRQSGLPLLDTAGAVECAAADGLRCSGPCGLTRPRAYFSASAIKNEKRNKMQTCNFCLRLVMCAKYCRWTEAKHFPLQGPACVACAQVTCASCGKTKAQNDFHKSDVKHYFYNRTSPARIAGSQAKAPGRAVSGRRD